MEAVTTGTRNTGVGMQTGHDLTTGGYNTYLGNFAGEYSTTGSYNTCVGDAAGSSFTTGSSNTFVGQQAGNAISTGSSNTIIGRYTGNSNGLDIRTSSNNIILASGDGVPDFVGQGAVLGKYLITVQNRLQIEDLKYLLDRNQIGRKQLIIALAASTLYYFKQVVQALVVFKEMVQTLVMVLHRTTD